jgi:hypothetical protein
MIYPQKISYKQLYTQYTDQLHSNKWRIISYMGARVVFRDGAHMYHHRPMFQYQQLEMRVEMLQRDAQK